MKTNLIKDINSLKEKDDISIMVKNGKINALVKGVENNGK